MNGFALQSLRLQCMVWSQIENTLHHPSDVPRDRVKPWLCFRQPLHHSPSATGSSPCPGTPWRCRIDRRAVRRSCPQRRQTSYSSMRRCTAQPFLRRTQRLICTQRFAGVDSPAAPAHHTIKPGSGTYPATTGGGTSTLSTQRWQNRRSGCGWPPQSELNDVYLAAGEHEGWPRFESGQGMYLYYRTGSKRWFINVKFTPHQDGCQACIDAHAGGPWQPESGRAD